MQFRSQSDKFCSQSRMFCSHSNAILVTCTVALFAFEEPGAIDREHVPAAERTPASHFWPESVDLIRLLNGEIDQRFGFSITP